MMSSMSILIPTYLILAVAICGSSAAEIFDYANRRGDERTPSRQSYYGTIGKGQQLNSNQQNRSQPSPSGSL
jgi:hypothetical protein